MKQSSEKNRRRRWNISRWAIAKPWLTICFWLTVTIAGLFAFTSLKYALFPEVSFPVVVLQAQGNFDTAIETENAITAPIENAVKVANRVQGTLYPKESNDSEASLEDKFKDLNMEDKISKTRDQDKNQVRRNRSASSSSSDSSHDRNKDRRRNKCKKHKKHNYNSNGKRK